MLPDVYFAYQPIVDLKQMRIVAFEALARTSDSHTACPGTLIPTEPNARAAIELALLELALAGKPQRQGYLSVNLSATTIPKGIQEILQDAEQYGPFCIEIIESGSLSLEQTEQLITASKQLITAGCCVALDDVGTGADRLLLLCSGVVSIAKTDRSLLKKPQLLATTVATAKRLGVKVVVEGIETPAQLGTARKAKADFLQGYLLGKPQPAMLLART